MRFEIYVEIQTPSGKSHSQMIWEIMLKTASKDAVGSGGSQGKGLAEALR